ncbi:hypothetical protein GCM10007907_08130 [Chitinimonas prasina]|uniref:Lipoprotein n=1 Tax=Chitinimonas prasina TaxID=1434937 RepID=A0ABQ5YEG8_9NEIS|nr:hypothetical protein [Chitinimonas prasina]GLR12023.1 hypothetical protein GCM10007907_08130 [Chitinimonas prasina]
MTLFTRTKSLLIAGLGLLLGACAHPIVLVPNDATTLPAVSKINKQIAYVITPAQRTLEVTTPGGGGDKVRYFPYRDLEVPIYKALSDVFPKVQVAASVEEANKLAGVDYVLVPTLQTTSSSNSAFTWPPTDFSVTISSKVADIRGQAVWEGSVTGNGHAEFSEFKRDFPLAARRASADALQKFRAQLAAAAALRDGAAMPVAAAVQVSPLAAETQQPVAPAAVAAQAPAAVLAKPVEAEAASEPQLANLAKLEESKLRQGPASYEVEQMAKAAGCEGSGAWVVSSDASGETYKVSCKTGKPYFAACAKGSNCLAL